MFLCPDILVQSRKVRTQPEYQSLYPDDFFDKDWSEYKTGFGKQEGDFWIGLDTLYNLTSLAGADLDWKLEVWYNTYNYSLMLHN